MTISTVPRHREFGSAARLFGANVALLGLWTLTAACGLDGPTPVFHRLSGTVLLETPNGTAPAPFVRVEETLQRVVTTTDARGRYSFGGLRAGLAHIRISYTTFEQIDRDVQIVSDTVADFQLIPRPLVTLTGRITQMTLEGPVPVPGVEVLVAICPPRPSGAYQLDSALTDADGIYRIERLCEGPTFMFVHKTGYVFTSPNDPFCDDHGDECRWFTITGDTRFDFVLAKNQ